jgi:hypothetical protein
MTAAAVLEIHMVMKAVPSINPRTMRLGLVPIFDTIFKAMRRWRPHCCMEAAIHIPPRNRKFTGSTYCTMIAGRKTPEKRGKTKRGRQAVAQSGTGSMIHQAAIQATVAAAQLWSAGSPLPFRSKPSTRNRIGPSKRPIRCRVTGDDWLSAFTERHGRPFWRAF